MSSLVAAYYNPAGEHLYIDKFNLLKWSNHADRMKVRAREREKESESERDRMGESRRAQCSGRYVCISFCTWAS